MRPASASGGGELRGRGLTPRDFLKRYELPRAASVLSCGLSTSEPALPPGGVLLYKAYRSERVEALLEGSRLAIPLKYGGWFSVVTERGQIKARCYTCLGKLVAGRVSSFLSLTPLTGYVLSPSPLLDGEKQHYRRRKVAGGETLKLLGVYQDIGKGGTRYAQLLAQDGRILYVPTSSTGQYYAIGGSARSEDCVYRLPRLLRLFPLPVRVCIIDGCQAQGSMVLERGRTEEVILACALGRDMRLLEIELESRFLLEDAQARAEHADVVSALRHLREQWEVWRRQPKVAKDVFEDQESVYAEVKDSVQESEYAEVSLL